MAPVIINFVAARSCSGKTTLIIKLLPLLKEKGLKVAALKGNLKHFDLQLDLPGKDSFRFAEAGADIAGLTTADSFMLTAKTCLKNGSEAAAELLKDYDLIIIEGNKKSDNPKIEVVRQALSEKPVLAANTIAIATDCEKIDTELPLLPIDDPKALADFIMNSFFKSIDHESTAKLTHFDGAGRPRMVDVSAKENSLREAWAKGEIVMEKATLKRVLAGTMAKGDVLAVAQVAAVMAVKETGRLIPMAHPLGITGVEVSFDPLDDQTSKIEIGVRVKLKGQTGVEMEALTGVSVAALTIYDMCKAIDKNMVIQNIRLVEKKGGRSGHFRREQI